MTFEQLESRVRALEAKMQELETIGPLATQQKPDKPTTQASTKKDRD
jgi:hypothetical protein